MNQDKRQRTLAAAIPLLLIASVLAVMPAQADHGSGVVTAEGVAAGGRHTCVLLSGGDVDCYGDNTYGQSADYNGGDAVGVAAGGFHTCVLLSGGDVDCYGRGHNSESADYTGGDAVGVAAGAVHTCVLTSGGNVDCYGSNGHGQAEDYNGGDAVGVGAGDLHTCVLTSSGNVHCYGNNGYGQAADYLGGDAVDVAVGNRHTCVLSTVGTVHCYGRIVLGQQSVYVGAVGVAAGGLHTCILRMVGTVDCYGYNDNGRAEDYLGGDAVDVAAGGMHTCVLLSGGDVDCYGHDDYRQSADWYGDNDGDGVHNEVDNCLSTSNPGQSDMDGDGIGDACDDDADGDGWINDVETLCGSDPMDADSVPPFGCIGAESTGDITSKQFLHEDNVTVTPSQDVPPEDVNGTATPDYPGTDPKETPDYNGTDPVPTPDHNGTEPVPTPEAGERVATVTVRDEGELVCLDVTPEGGSAIPVSCLDRDRLGPADPHVPRGDTVVVYFTEEETPDLPGTPSQDVPDVPGTDPEPVPDVPGTDPQPVPDAPPVPGGLITTPEVTVSLDVTYRYDPGRLNHEGSFLGTDVWSPVGPGDEAWFLASGTDVGMTVTVSVYEDGQHVATVPVFVPYLGQAFAAAEMTAGTL